IRCGNRCSVIVRQLAHCLPGEPRAVGLASVMRGHCATMPTEDGLKLRLTPGQIAVLLKMVSISQVLYGTDYPFRNGAEVNRGIADWGFASADPRAIPPH